MNIKLLSKPAHRRLIGLVIAATTFVGGISVYAIFRFGLLDENFSSKPTQAATTVKKVTALARLLPEAEVIRLSPPLVLDGDRISELLVKEGDKVKKGQIVAILDSRERLQVVLQEAEKKMKLVQAKIAQVKAGASLGEIEAQKANIERIEAQLQGDKVVQLANIRELQAQLQNFVAEYQRYRQLLQEGAISYSMLDSKRLNVETVTQQLSAAKAVLQRIEITGKQETNQARGNLRKITEVRPVDIEVGEAELEAAKAAVKKAQTDLNMTYLRAPKTGQILKIHTHDGEKIGAEGVADIAQTDQMMAVAEIYQTDINKIRVGQKAIISSQAFSEKLQGEVEQIGLMVDRQNIFSNRPGENFDRRVVSVKIRLTPEDSKRVSGLTNLQVIIAIHL
jgi:HlyD family secretion protein